MTDIPIEEIASEIGSNSSAELPEATGAGASSEFLEILRANPGKWISSSMVTAEYKKRNLPTKYIANKMSQIGKRDDVVVEKVDGRNYFQFVGSASSASDSE